MNPVEYLALSPSDIIQIIGIIASLITSLIAIIISVITIRQNNKMLEESSRPYISIYIETITICEQTSYIVLKNFGNTSATITKFHYDPVLRENIEISEKILREQFDYVKGIILSPQQKKLLFYNFAKLPENIQTVSFTIGYESSSKYYEESFSLNVRNYIHIPVSRPSSDIPPKNARQVHTLREILEKLI